MTTRKSASGRFADPQTCEECHGKKHVFNRETRRWKKCSCLKRVMSLVAYQQANIPTRYHAGSLREAWREFFNTYRTDTSDKARILIGAAHELKDENAERPGIFLVLYGGPAKARDMVSALLGRSACDGGRTTLLTDLPGLIDHAFKRTDEETLVDPYKQNCLIVSIGHEPAHKWNRNVLEKATCDRWNRCLPTILVINGDEQRASCGSTRAEATLHHFEKIRLTTRTA